MYGLSCCLGCATGDGLGQWATQPATQSVTQSDVDALVNNVRTIAQAIWGNDKVAEAEAWINQQLLQYGINYAKYKAQQAYGAVSEYLQNPIVVFGVGFIVAAMLFRR